MYRVDATEYSPPRRVPRRRGGADPGYHDDESEGKLPPIFDSPERDEAQDGGLCVLVPLSTPFVWGKRGTKRVLEYARLAMEFAHVRASRYGIR